MRNQQFTYLVRGPCSVSSYLIYFGFIPFSEYLILRALCHFWYTFPWHEISTHWCLTHCFWWGPCGVMDLSQISSGDGLMPSSNKPLPWFIFVRFCVIHLRAILPLVPGLLFCIMGVKIIRLKLLPHLMGQWVNTLGTEQNGVVGDCRSSKARFAFQFTFDWA